MKRYDFKPNTIRNPDDLTYGDYVEYDEAHAIEQERDALKARLDERIHAYDANLWLLGKENCDLKAELAALKAPPKILKAEEVKEPGCYWWRREENTDWSVQNVYLPGAGKLLVGQFIGPIPKPEVCDD